MSSFARISRINYCADLCADSADASINRAIIAQNSSHKRNFRPRATTWGHRNLIPSPTGIALKETGVWMSRPTKGEASSSRLQVPVGSGERTFCGDRGVCPKTMTCSEPSGLIASRKPSPVYRFKMRSLNTTQPSISEAHGSGTKLRTGRM